LKTVEFSPVASFDVPLLKSGGRVSPPEGERVRKHVFSFQDHKWNSEEIRVHLNCEPFAKGTQRFCYHLKDLSMPAAARDHVAKMFRPGLDGNYFLDCALHSMAAGLAEVFNNIQASKYKLKFLDGFVFEFLDRVNPDNEASPVLMSVEPWKQGYLDHLTWGNGQCVPCGGPHDADGKFSTVSAFGHFTHHVSGGSLVVTDLQAFDSYTPSTQLVLTDPMLAAHPTYIKEHGLQGFIDATKYIWNHKCTHICSLLGLMPLRAINAFKPTTDGLSWSMPNMPDVGTDTSWGVAPPPLPLPPVDGSLLDRIISTSTTMSQQVLSQKAGQSISKNNGYSSLVHRLFSAFFDSLPF